MKISIVTICYNAARDLQRTIESVLSQDCPDIEYIIVDGGSTDDTLDVVRAYGDRISKFVSEPDDGISDAINKGIRLSTGEVVGLLHAADTYEPHAVSTAANAFAENPDCDVVHGNICYADAFGNALYEQGPDFRDGIIWKKMPFHHPTCFVRKMSYGKFGFFDSSYKVAMDYELMLRFHRGGAKFVYVDRTLAVMCLQGLSDRNWRRSIAESRRAAVAHGRNPVSARVTELGRTFRTAATALYFGVTGKTVRQSFPAFRKHGPAMRAMVDAVRCRRKNNCEG